jgi:hypothetical protein
MEIREEEMRQLEWLTGRDRLDLVVNGFLNRDASIFALQQRYGPLTGIESQSDAALLRMVLKAKP